MKKNVMIVYFYLYFFPADAWRPAADGKRKNKGGANHDPGLYDLPSFTARITLDLGRKFPSALKRATKVESEPLHRSGRLPMPRKIPANHIICPSRVCRWGRRCWRRSCWTLPQQMRFFFLALVARLAAFGWSLALLAGATNWVDTWEPIDLLY